jgi:hypothetical protein
MPMTVVTTNNAAGLQIVTVSPTGVTIGQEFTLDLFGVTVSFTATVATSANVVTGLLAAIAASTDPEWDNVTSEPSFDGNDLIITWASDAGTLRIWRGDAPPVAQVTHVTPTSVDAGDEFTLLCNGKSITVTAVVASAANVVQLLAAAISASELPEWQEMSAEVSGNMLVLTANVPGIPFTVTSGNTADGGVPAVIVTHTQSGQTTRNHKQSFTLPTQGSGGTFTVNFGGYTTSALNFSDNAATVQTALQGLTSIGSGNCAVSKTGSTFTVEFTGTMATVVVAPLTVVFTNANPQVEVDTVGSAVAPLANAKQIIRLPDGTASDSGTFTITYDGQTTSAIPGNEVPLNIAAYLVALSNISQVTVLRNADLISVEFTGVDGYRNHATMTATDVSLANDKFAITVTTTQEPRLPGNSQQLIYLTGNPPGGTFTLTFDGQTTSGIAYNASASTIDTALEGLSNIGSGDLTVTGSAGGPWTVTFGGSLAAQAVAGISGNGSGLTPSTSQALDVDVFVASAGPNHWDDPLNWEPAGIPADFDRVRFEFGATSCLYGLDQSEVTLTELEIRNSYTGAIGLPRLNGGGYVEYRTRDLTITVPSVLIGHGEGPGSGKIALNTLEGTTYLECRASGGSSESGVPAVTWRGDNPATEIVVVNGDFGTAVWSDQTANFKKLEAYGGTIRLDHAALEYLYAPNVQITAHETTLGGQPLEL